jgi:thiamine biosynthesis lipoprotein
MGTEVMVIVMERAGRGYARQTLADVERLFREEERRFTRFREDSELSRMNADGCTGSPSRQMWDVLVRARRWWRETGGTFDPTVLGALERAGYDRTFVEIAAAERARACEASAPRIGFGGVRLLDRNGTRAVRLDEGLRVDLGGIVKGWTVDRAAELLACADSFLIDAGGDITARGDGPGGPGWWVAVEDPFQLSTDRAYVQVMDGSVATSGVYARAWRAVDGRAAHHLIDPATGAPSESAVLSVTVLGRDTETCEVLAKTALLRGPDAGLTFLEGFPEASGMMVLKDGTERATPGWRGVPGTEAVLETEGMQ